MLVFHVSSGAFSYALMPATVDWRGKDFWIETVISGKVSLPREKITRRPLPFILRPPNRLPAHLVMLKFDIGTTSYVVVTTAGLRVNSGGVTFPDGSFMVSPVRDLRFPYPQQ